MSEKTKTTLEWEGENWCEVCWLPTKICDAAALGKKYFYELHGLDSHDTLKSYIAFAEKRAVEEYQTEFEQKHLVSAAEAARREFADKLLDKEVDDPNK